MESWREFTEMVMAVLFVPFFGIGLYCGTDVAAGVLLGYMGLLALSVYYD